MRLKNTSGVAVATAAAMLFGTGLVSTAAAGSGSDAKIHCTGVNACKGQNSCKGQGFLEMSKKECQAAQDKAKSGEGK